jgi:uncharacterized repeat protein (TIGR01451 family)
LTYTLIVTNTGPDQASAVVVTDSLPSGVTLANASVSQGNCSGSTLVTCHLGQLSVNSIVTITLTTIPTQPGIISNTAHLTANETDGQLLNNTATVSVTVNPASELSLTQTDDPDPAVVGAPLTYTLVVLNGHQPDTGVTLTNTLPANVLLHLASASAGVCNGTGPVVCAIGGLAAGESVTVSIRVTPTAAGLLTNTATVTGEAADANPANNTATQETTVTTQADLALTMSIAPPSVRAGTSVTYTLSITNYGPSPASNVSVADTLPGSLLSPMASASQGNCTGTFALTCALGSLASGASATITITALTPANALVSLNNTASVSSNDADPNSLNNSASANASMYFQFDLFLPLVRR